jgi:putative OPT family oligopeptide transporter
MSSDSSSAPPPDTDVSIPPPPGPDASPEEKDLYWFRHVYQGDRQKQLTLRAVLTGGLLGAFLSLSNLYTTLKIGWSFGVAITACVMSWSLWKAVQAISGGRLKEMSLLETNCMQSTASSAGYSTGSVVGTGCAALLMVNNGVHMPWHVLTPFVFLTACLGVFLAIPLKRQMINHEQLPFPSGIAAAETLRSLYAAGKAASQKAYSLIRALTIAAAFGVVRQAGELAQLASGWLGETTTKAVVKFSHAIQHVTIPQPLALSPLTGKPVLFAELKFDPSLVTIGAGMIVGLRASCAMLASSAFLHFVLGPILVANNAVEVNDKGMTALFRWGVWGGTSLMVVSSLVALGFQWKTIARAFRRGNGADGGPESARMAAIEVPGQWMYLGLIPISLGLIIVLQWGLNIPWYLAVIGIILAFPLALVACRSTGETDTTPIGAMGKVTQLMFAALHPGNKVTNLGTACTTAGAAASAADLLTDLKSGYVLGANPRRQFWAQLSGVLFGTAMIVPAWYLIAGNDLEKLKEKFPMASASAWKAMADLLNPASGKSAFASLPWGAVTAIIIGAVLGVILPVLEKFFPKYRNWIPSAMGLGLGFVIDFASGLGFTVGALIAWVWKQRNAAQAENYTVPVASGFVAGQALMEALIIIFVAAMTFGR